MKAAPVYRALRESDASAELLLVHTGQHYDTELSSVFLEELELPHPDIFLGVGSGTHAEQTARAMVGVEKVLLERRPSLCVVAGDVNSTLAGALAASKLHVPVAHIEAGLRSFDEAMPEEANRRLTDHLSRILLAHSEGAVVNLTNENIDSSRIHLVGNTMIDSVLRHLPFALGREPWSAFGVEPGGFALVTLHRPALVDDLELLHRTVVALVDLARELPVVFPVHPRTEARLQTAGFEADRLRDAGLMLSRPLGYLEFLALEAKAAFVLTDSGGIQEETSVLGVRCFTLRDTTERPITVERGTNTVLGVDPEAVRAIPAMLVQTNRVPPEIPLWDGRAGSRAAAVITSFLASIPDGPHRPIQGSNRRDADAQIPAFRRGHREREDRILGS
jgi:UDP-N-acetylglucosamine 2-epimerase (non-hydrolysing)